LVLALSAPAVGSAWAAGRARWHRTATRRGGGGGGRPVVRGGKPFAARRVNAGAGGGFLGGECAIV